MDSLDLLAVQGTLKSLLQHHSSKASIFQHSAFFTVQLSHPYMTTGKTIALTRWTFVGKAMSLLFNMLSRLVLTFRSLIQFSVDKILKDNAAAAAKSLQSCLTLCDPIDSSPLGPLSLGFSRKEHWSELPFPSPVHESEKQKWSWSVMSDSQRPHGLQPTRLLCPRDSPGKSTRVDCCTQYASKFGKLSSGHRTGKGQFSFQFPKWQCQRMLKLLHNCTHLTC